MSRNRIRCELCDEIIESTFCHDFKYCDCGAIFVDGGKAYSRYGGDLENIIVVYDDDSEKPLAEIISVPEPPPIERKEFEPVTDDEIFYDIEKLHEQIEERDVEIIYLKERVLELERRLK